MTNPMLACHVNNLSYERMRPLMRLKTALTVMALSIAMTPPAWANSLTFQGVTFGLTDLGSGSLQFTINNALSGGTGDWADITHIQNFQFKNIGATTMSFLPNWSVNNLELNANVGGSGTACDGGSGSGVGRFCFTKIGAPLALTDSRTFNITYTGALNLTAPELKVRFTDANGNKIGSLLSQTVPASVPLPGTSLLFGVGMMLLGGWRYRQSRQS
jgi:hypothetical protein